MKRRTWSGLGAGVLVALGVAIALSPITGAARSEKQAQAESLIRDWPESSRRAARLMLEKYGEPDGVTDDTLLWQGNGDWKRTIVHREEVVHNFPERHMDVLEQTIEYRVPVGSFNDLARFNGSVVAERTNGELSARCDREETNRLSLNLSDEIVRGERTVDEAREFLARTARLGMAGRGSRYTDELLHERRRGGDRRSRRVLHGPLARDGTPPEAGVDAVAAPVP